MQKIIKYLAILGLLAIESRGKIMLSLFDFQKWMEQKIEALKHLR